MKAQKENFAASKEEYTGVMISMAAEVASAYINLREFQQQLEVVKKNVASQEEVLKITEVRYEQHEAHQNSLISLPYSAALSSFRPAVFLFYCSFPCSGICFFLFVYMLLHFYLLLRDFTPCKKYPGRHAWKSYFFPSAASRGIYYT